MLPVVILLMIYSCIEETIKGFLNKGGKGEKDKERVKKQEGMYKEYKENQQKTPNGCNSAETTDTEQHLKAE